MSVYCILYIIFPYGQLAKWLNKGSKSIRFCTSYHLASLSMGKLILISIHILTHLKRAISYQIK